MKIIQLFKTTVSSWIGPRGVFVFFPGFWAKKYTTTTKHSFANSSRLSTFGTFPNLFTLFRDHLSDSLYDILFYKCRNQGIIATELFLHRSHTQL